VRFSILGEQAGLVRIVYIMERDHAPVEHREIQYAIAESRVVGEASELVAAQVGAFLRTYLSRRASSNAAHSF